MCSWSALFAVLLALSTGLRLVSYHPVADGELSRYVRVAVAAAVVATAGYLLVRGTGGRQAAALALGLTVLLLADAVHYARLAYAASWNGEVLLLSGDFSRTGIRGWRSAADVGAEVRVGGGSLAVATVPGARAWLEAAVPIQPATQGRFWLPAATLTARYRDTLELEGRVSFYPGAQFLVLFEAGPVVVQATPYGLHVSAPDAAGEIQGYELHGPSAGGGAESPFHHWRLERWPAEEVTLAVDGQTLWRGPDRSPVREVRLGEPRTDRLHGGTFEVRWLRYVRRYVWPEG